MGIDSMQKDKNNLLITRSSKHFMTGGILLMVLLVVVDQLTKQLASTYVSGNGVSVIPGVFRLLYVENQGAAFGLFKDRRFFFILIAVMFLAAGAALLHHLADKNPPALLRIAGFTLMAGAAGNLIDRIFLGYVRDFLYVELIDFPVFNAADIFITVSAAVIALHLLISDTGEREPNAD